MTWESRRAQTRIKELMQSVPTIVSEQFDEIYLPQFFAEKQAAEKRGVQAGRPLINLPKNKAVVVDGVHIYATLVNYDEYRVHEGLETEDSHARALNFLHLHYGTCDRAIERHGAQRVDFHGPRVHAVVIEPAGREFAQERALIALRLAREIEQLSGLANTQIAEGRYPAKFRIGIDAGVCAAINGGRGVEQEPLFLGSPANHAAKLAEGDEPGIYISDNIRHLFSLPLTSSIDDERRFGVGDNTILEIVSALPTSLQESYAESHVTQLLREWQTEIEGQQMAVGGASKFRFHYHQPPLETIRYEDLSPSNSIRMPLISIFADIDGYTSYIDRAVAGGHVGDAIRALHVIRGELNHVLKKDFRGRKVRFVGDCIHGLIAEGNATRTDNPGTVKEALRCAGGMRSSFELCQEMLTNVDELGLAVGMELGPTPISRVGIRGERSVRLASSIATTQSESIQKNCKGHQTAIGPSAYDAATRDVQQLFANTNIVDDFFYHDAELLIVAVKASAEAQSPAPLRAHACP